jgi:hypothetical protein
MSANDNLSTKCSGLLLRSSFAILAARTRHLFSSVLMLAGSSPAVEWGFFFSGMMLCRSDTSLGGPQCTPPSLMQCSHSSAPLRQIPRVNEEPARPRLIA